MNEKSLNVNTDNTMSAVDIEKVATLQLHGEVGTLRTAYEAMPAVTCEMKLPSAEEYAQKDAEYQQHYWKWSTRRWSPPMYVCPECKEGGMCRDETVVLTSIPPKHMYECNKCHHVEYHSI